MEKGSIVFVNGWWFVVIKHDGEYIYCVCDNANNRYVYEKSEIEYSATPKEALRANGWSDGPEELLDLKNERCIPVDIIAEVLVGLHDNKLG